MTKEKPIIFSTPMVKAILDGKKTQTRRVIRGCDDYCIPLNDFIDNEKKTFAIRNQDPEGNPISLCERSMPMCVGDTLWIRETFANIRNNGFLYKADPMFDTMKHGDYGRNWKPSIHMPRAAARIFLKVKSVRVERLHGISEEDAKAEGVEPVGIFNDLDGNESICVGQTYIEPFANLWDLINAKSGYSWESNPWVWVYTFKKIELRKGENG